MQKADILFAMSGDVYRNSRALKQIRALSACGWRIHVLALKGNGQAVEFSHSVVVEQISIGESRGYRFFRELHAEMSRKALGIEASCYHASDLYVLKALSHASVVHGGVYTYDSRELYPHVSATVRRPWVRWYWSILEERLIRGAAIVFTVSKKIADHLESTYRIRRPILVRNVPPMAVVPRTDKLATLASLDEAVPIILHLGQMRIARGCEVLVQAMAQIDNAKLIFLGYGPERETLERLSRRLGLEDRVLFLDPVAPDEVLAYTAGATIGVTLLEDTCLNHRYALPNKLFDYLMAGVPVLASDLPELRTLVQGYNVGRTADSSDPDDVARVLMEMLGSETDRNTWIRNAERLCETFNWENASQRFTKAFRRLIPVGKVD